MRANQNIIKNPREIVEGDERLGCEVIERHDGGEYGVDLKEENEVDVLGELWRGCVEETALRLQKIYTFSQ